MISGNKYGDCNYDWWYGNNLDRLRNDCKRDWYADNRIYFLRSLENHERDARRWIKANWIDLSDRVQDDWLTSVKQDLYQSVNWLSYCNNMRNDVIAAFKQAMDEQEVRMCGEVPPAGLTDAEALYWQAGRAAQVWSHHWRSLEQQFLQEAAAQRARRLLVDHLTPAQRIDFERSGTFQVVSLSNRRYRIRQERYANVDVLDTAGAVRHRLCAHPAMNVPVADVMLAQLLMLRHDEEQFLQLARVHPPVTESIAGPAADQEDGTGDYRMAG